MAATDPTVDVSTDIASYDFLKLVNQHFGELAGHYINMFQSYHAAFAVTALNIVLMGGAAWVLVLMIKAPADKMRTAGGALAVLTLSAILLADDVFTIPGAYNDVQLANGAGWSVQIVGNIYQLFKEGLDSVKDEDAFQIAFDNAYHITDEETLKRFVDSPVADMYKDYINLCQPAFESIAGKNPQARSAGRFVGFYGSAGIGQAEVQWDNANSLIDQVTGKDPDMNELVNSTAWFNRDGGDKIREGVESGVALLKAIPEEQNPFDGKTVPFTGYKIPTKEYWVQELFQKDIGTSEIYYDSSDVEGMNYRNSAYSEEADSDSYMDPAAAYPKNCYELYRMLDQGQRAWQAAIEENTRVGQATALGRDGRDATMMMYTDIENQIRAQGRTADTPLQTLAGYGAVNLLDHDGGMRLGEMLKDASYTTFADIGSTFREWMLKYMIPMSINGCAMLVGLLVVMFPLVCVMAVFISPKILVSYVKLMAFAFIVPFTNDACLSMAATLLSVNGELIEGYNAGNFAKNNTLLISAGTAQYVVFIAICAIEVIFAKMLIWDDVKGMSNFNPGGGALGLAATGAAVVGTVMKLASFGRGAFAARASAGGGAPSGSGGPSGAATKMAQQQAISGGARIVSGGRSQSSSQPAPLASRMSSGKDAGEAPLKTPDPGFLKNPVPTSVTKSPLSRPSE
ncbi:hypothetical protein ACQYZY_28965 [Pseudomonas aeruginosa]|jgi:hypothetical protein|uniref:hypothetical protein n=1 Tax=Pseudomonas aeruginosa TaxID=287 RepID=UPI001A30A800|nr:hypothetical protein [Pseudomonas aeruginosa]EKV0397993.1 hypothetical protein [Pseudomonas aeruginosa]EKV3013022.1 hypothetical protein [Pseudomonas aeruginosa]MBH4318329.1 hypothetical protein [Pseudomonas aeruginosa]MBH8702827.1 hypothetical protein [Pseudomonas aeruginosa]WBM10986.1 hypothetical protein M1V28_31775 [Pseudomonas aeruginosa]